MTTTRIVSIDPAAVAKIFAWLYGMLAILGLITLAISGVERLTYLSYPFGFVVPGFHLDLRLNLLLPQNPIGRSAMFLACIPAYAVTGWLSGYLVALCFNLLAKRLGGISARVRLEEQGQVASTAV
jgi:hypothetical protein